MASTMTTMPRRSYISATIIYEPSLKSMSFLSVQTMRARKSAQVSQLCQALEPWYQLKWNGDGVICFLRDPLTLVVAVTSCAASSGGIEAPAV